MNDASQEIDKTPDAGIRFMFDGLQLVTKKRLYFRGDADSCMQCYAKARYQVCSAMPSCGNAGAEDARLFVPDLEHEPTAQRIALMRLRGEL